MTLLAPFCTRISITYQLIIGAIFRYAVGRYILAAAIDFDGTGTVNFVGESKIYTNPL